MHASAFETRSIKRSLIVGPGDSSLKCTMEQLSSLIALNKDDNSMERGSQACSEPRSEPAAASELYDAATRALATLEPQPLLLDSTSVQC